MIQKTNTLLILCLAACLVSAAAWSQESLDEAQSENETTGFEEILEHYEIVRLALLNDSLDGIADEVAAISKLAAELDQDWSAERAGVHPDAAEDAHGLLAPIATAAQQIQTAEDINAARDAFFELSVPMLALQKAAEGATSIVAYCPMANRSWLQPEGEIGNPYFGQEMATCGEVVKD